MNNDRYIKVENTSDYRVFTFVSEGRYGHLVKIVRFDELQRDNTYNLALGTVLSDGKIDFSGITNNGDRNKVLATVASIIYIFTKKYPENYIYITGSDNRRTLLYQRAIIYAYDELIQTFNIYGDASLDDEATDFEPFIKGKGYSGFLIERK